MKPIFKFTILNRNTDIFEREGGQTDRQTETHREVHASKLEKEFIVSNMLHPSEKNFWQQFSEQGLRNLSPTNCVMMCLDLFAAMARQRPNIFEALECT